MNETKSQNEMILDYLRIPGNSLTPISALERFGTLRLGGRIWDLRREGYNIKTEVYITPSGKHVARYYLVLESQSELFTGL